MEKINLRIIYITLISVMSLIASTKGQRPNKKTWTYELKEISSTSSDPEKMKIDLEIVRVSRGVFAISGDILINIDIVDGDSNKIQANTYRSVRGDNDYKVMPFEIPNTQFLTFLNTHYKDVFMNTLKECSDMPVFEDEFQPPLEKKTYKLDSCQFSQEGLPNHMQEGFYKLTLAGSGEVEYQIDVIVEVTPDF